MIVPHFDGEQIVLVVKVAEYKHIASLSRIYKPPIPTHSYYADSGWGP